MSDIAHEMLRMFGLSMGIDVKSNQRLAKIREIREQEMQEIAEGKSHAKEPTVLLRRGKTTTGSTPWIPFKKKADR